MPITVTRLQAQAMVAPLGCSVNAVITISNGAVSGSLAITAAANDSGPLTLNYAAGIPITLGVSTAPGCRGGIPPALANVVAQYKAQ
jgi:hypothetical protein